MRTSPELQRAHEDGRTLDMNNPNRPPRANPIPPEITVFAGQLSIAICIYHTHVSRRVLDDDSTHLQS